MYTVFHPELADLAREILARHRAYQAGAGTPAELEEYQLERFVATLDYVRKHSDFYRERLADVEPGDIKALTPEALSAIPFTTKDDLRAFGFDVPCLPASEAWVHYETTGTTGDSTPSPRADVDSINTNIAMTVQYEPLLRSFGDQQVMGVCGPSELHAHGDTFTEVCRNLGLATVKMWPYSPMVGFQRALRVLRDLPVTGLFCTPGMAVALAKAAIRAGSDPRRDFRMEVLMLTGETAPPSVLAHIGELWQAQPHLALYGSQESSVLALPSADGALRPAPLLNHYEVVDPQTQAQTQTQTQAQTQTPTPATADAAGIRHGELVATHLYQGAKPLVRYRTGDLVRLHPDARIEVLGRIADRLTLNGADTTGYDLENLLLDGVRGYLDHRVVIERRAGRDTVVLALTPESEGARPTGLAASAEACRAAFGVEVEIRVGDVEDVGDVETAVPATGPISWKTPRLHDRRPSQS